MLNYYEDITSPGEFIMKFEENEDFITVYFADGHVQYYECNEDYKKWILKRQEEQLDKVLNLYYPKNLDQQRNKVYAKAIALLLGTAIPEILLLGPSCLQNPVGASLFFVGNTTMVVAVGHQVNKTMSKLDELREELEKYSYWREHKEQLADFYNVNNIDDCSTEQIQKVLEQTNSSRI